MAWELELLSVEYIRCVARGGAEIGQCCVEAARLAINCEMEVHFLHNGKTYKASFSEMMKTVGSSQ
jgi:hypothetical protein